MEAAADLSAAALALQVDLLQLPPEIPAPGAPALRGVLDRLFAHWLSLPDTAASSSPPPLRIRRDPNPSLVELAAGPVEVADEAYEFRAPKYFDFVNDETEDEVRAAERWFEASVSHAPSPFAPRIKESRMEVKINSLCDFADAEPAPKDTHTRNYLKCPQITASLHTLCMTKIRTPSLQWSGIL